MSEFTIFNIGVVLVFAFIGWLLCFAVMGMGMGMKFTTMNRALIMHATAAPLIFIALSFIYFKYFNFTTPLETAVIFIVFVMLMDFFFVALIINKSLDMFRSLIGTWIPFLLYSQLHI